MRIKQMLTMYAVICKELIFSWSVINTLNFRMVTLIDILQVNVKHWSFFIFDNSFFEP
jgi:hypothetical protein